MSTTRRTDTFRVRGSVAALGVLVVALVGIGTAGAASPSPSASVPAQTPVPSVGVGTVTWEAVDGTSGSVPGTTMGAGHVVAWAGGFAALGNGVWVSPDGRSWTGHPLPREIDGQGLSLLTWRGGLLLVEPRPREQGWRFRLWSSSDGREWQRAGTFDQRPVGRLDDCAFTYPSVVSTDARILAMASCVPYANGGIGPAVAQLTAADARSEPRVPIWAWTSDDGTRWSRHLVTDRLDPAGAVRIPALVEAIGDGFGAILCCYPPSVWWSDDGASWRETMGLPSSVGYESLEALDAFVQDGKPETWLLFADKDHEHPDPGLTGALGTLWTGDGTHWTEVVGRYDWQDGAIATDGETALAVTARILDTDPEEVRVDTLTSTDGGRGWTVSEGDELADVECCFGEIALQGGRAVLAGPWGPESTTVRTADISAGHSP